SQNMFALASCAIGSFQSGDVGAVDWSDVLDGGGLSGTLFTAASLSTWRPAPNLTADPILHLIVEGPTREVVYGSLSGTNAGADIALSTTDLTTGGPVSPFATPPQPH